MRSLVLFMLLTFTTAAFGEDTPKDGWKNESQAGIVLTSGNTTTQTLSAGQATSYTLGAYTYKLGATYLYQENANVVAGKRWTLGARFERAMSESFSLFLAQSAEGDRFAGIRQRYNTDLGGKYMFLTSDSFHWSGELGYRYTKQNLLTKSEKLHYARLYTEVEKKFSPTVTGKYWIEYLPNFTISDDWQINTEASVAAALSSVFSIKTGYLVRFDNVVNSVGLKKTDKTFTTSLVAKF